MTSGDGSQGDGPAAPARSDTRAFLDDCPQPIAEIFRYWDGLRQGCAMPRRAAFRPEAVPRHLPAILLVDVEGIDEAGVGIYRYRVVGTESVRLRGRDPTGKLVREAFFWSSGEAAIAVYESVRVSRRHLYQTAEFVSPQGRWRSEHSILLPFSDDGASVTQILVYSVARSSRDR